MTNIYLLTGENIAEREHYFSNIYKNIINSNPNTLVKKFYGNELNEDEINEILNSSPLFGDTYLIVIKRCEALTSSLLDLLSYSIVDNDNKNIIIFEGKNIANKISAKHSFNKALSKAKTRISKKTFSNPPPYKIDDWIIKTADTIYNKKIDKQAASLLHSYTGDDLLIIMNELEKIDITLNKTNTITKNDIKNLSSSFGSSHAWDLPHPVARKEILTSLSILKNLYNYNIKSLQVLYHISLHFTGLLKLKLYFAEKPHIFKEVKRLDKLGFKGKEKFNEIMCDVANKIKYRQKPVSPKNVYLLFTIPKTIDQLKNFSIDDLKYIIKLINSIDFKLKTGLVKDELISMEKVVFQIIFCKKHKANTLF